MLNSYICKFSLIITLVTSFIFFANSTVYGVCGTLRRNVQIACNVDLGYCASVCGGEENILECQGGTTCVCDDGVCSELDFSDCPKITLGKRDICVGLPANQSFIACGQIAPGDSACCTSQPECDAISPPTPTPNLEWCQQNPPNNAACDEYCIFGNEGNGQCVNGVCTCELNDGEPGPTLPPFNPCTFSSEAGNCNDCVDNGGVWTALGCIPSNSNELIVGLIKFAMGMAGGIAFLIMLYGTFVIITASGNPEKVAGGQQTITSAIVGLLTIMFAAIILNIIGIQIIQIPGL